MPRTSYGTDKRSQAWTLLAALLRARGSSCSEQVTVKNAGITYCNWSSTEKPYLNVRSTLTDLAGLSGLSIEQVREALTAHLGEHLGIFEDKRSQKVGRNAGNWQFVLRLWSTDLAENQREFEALWQLRKSGGRTQLRSATTEPDSIDALVQEVRSRLCPRIREQHSKIRLLNLKNVEVDQLYVDVWVLERLPITLQVDLETYYQKFDLRRDRLGMGERIGEQKKGFEIAERETKLLILGKPGAGKTTFLKHLAVACSDAKFQSDLIPVFLELRKIQTQEFNLLVEIHKLFDGLQMQETKQLLTQGKLLILLDGLDEVSEQLRRTVQNHISEFAHHLDYGKNRFILTCRTQIIECPPQEFDCIEVADFQPNQVEKFVRNWFKACGMDDIECDQKWYAFETRLKENEAVRELTVTPVVLSLMCWVFEDTGDLPEQCSRLYRKGVDLMLKKWDESRDVERSVGSETYRQLSLKRKESLLNELAAWKFSQPENFVLFEQTKLVTKIMDILELSDEEEGEGVLKAIEAHHGLLVQRADELWSFSHLTFQEYFTAQWFVQRQDWQGLARNVFTSHWREVFLLTAQISYDADVLFLNLKQALDNLVKDSNAVQSILSWIVQKADAPELIFCGNIQCRCFYLDLIHNHELEKSLILNSQIISELTLYMSTSDPAEGIPHGLVLDHSLYWSVACCRLMTPYLLFDKSYIEEMTQLSNAFVKATESCRILLANGLIEIDFYHTLLELWNQLLVVKPEPRETFSNWWRTDGSAWVNCLREAMLSHRNRLSYDWLLSPEDTNLLKQYYQSGKLLIDCLNIVARLGNDQLRSQIVETLFLPTAEKTAMGDR